jgi:hypothetical protein
LHGATIRPSSDSSQRGGLVVGEAPIAQAEDELRYVLEGSVRFVSGQTSVVADEGGLAFLPRDIPHGFEVVGPAEARMLAVVAPSGFEAFVEELSETCSPNAFARHDQAGRGGTALRTGDPWATARVGLTRLATALHALAHMARPLGRRRRFGLTARENLCVEKS